jgi:hypothetical protein
MKIDHKQPADGALKMKTLCALIPIISNVPAPYVKGQALTTLRLYRRATLAVTWSRYSMHVPCRALEKTRALSPAACPFWRFHHVNF